MPGLIRRSSMADTHQMLLLDNWSLPCTRKTSGVDVQGMPEQGMPEQEIFQFDNGRQHLQTFKSHSPYGEQIVMLGLRKPKTSYLTESPRNTIQSRVASASLRGRFNTLTSGFTAWHDSTRTCSYHIRSKNHSSRVLVVVIHLRKNK